MSWYLTKKQAKKKPSRGFPELYPSGTDLQVRVPWKKSSNRIDCSYTIYTPNVSFLTKQQPVQQMLKNGHLVTQNMGCFQGLAILIVVCTVIICALQILCFFLLKKTRNVSSSRINEDLNGHNREPGDPREINIQWPHLNGRKQPIEHSEQPFNQAGFMTIT